MPGPGVQPTPTPALDPVKSISLPQRAGMHRALPLGYVNDIYRSQSCETYIAHTLRTFHIA